MVAPSYPAPLPGGSLGCPPFGSFIMSLEESDDLNIPDAESLDPALEASSLPKFDMHLYRSSLSETHVKWLTKCYDISEDLHPSLVPEVDQRAAPIAMAWRHHDSRVAAPFAKSGEHSKSDIAKLREVVIVLRKPPPSLLYAAGLSYTWKHASRAFSLKGPKGKIMPLSYQPCFLFAHPKPTFVVGALLPPGSARVTHLAPLAERLEGIPPMIGDMEIAEIPCRKVLDEKEKKKKKAEAKVAANVLDAIGSNGDLHLNTTLPMKPSDQWRSPL
ncbi:hypothetical protein Tco_0818292 [Tanacetum coccineum]